ncbi:MAG: type VI secretion system tip protein VgrG [Chitinophagaceae bacterium]|nr:type VI secretion system tip protein VgrG [Chitinophagaceae bacterium]
MPAQPTQDLSSFKVFSDGTELPGTFNIISVMVDKGINKVPVARIIMKDGDASAQGFNNSNKTELDPGKTIKIEAGFHNQTEVIFEGVIIKQNIRLKNGKDSFLVVECKDKSYPMTLVRKSAYFAESKDSDAIETIVGNYGLQKDITATTVTHKQLVQSFCTDWDFMISRSELNGMVVLCDNGKVIIKKPEVASSATATCTFGTDVLNFDAQFDATHQYQTITCKAWSFADQEITDADNEPVSITEAGDITSATLAGKVNGTTAEYVHSGKLTQDELKSWATAQQTKNILSKTRGLITCKGKFEAKPTETLELVGFGNHYNGKHFISAVRHELKDSLWETSIQFGWWPELFTEQYTVNQPPAAGVIAAVPGLQIGVVTALEGDPESEFRIQVRFPLMDNQAEGIWARVALLDAGKERGSYFMPEVDDEVIVGFINADPRDAIILGMVNSSSKPAPFTPSDDNDEKGFVTRSKMKLVFNDKKPSVTIETPGGRMLILDDDAGKITIKDKKKNTIEMSDDGILIDSSKDIILKAKKDIKGDGVNVEIKASGNFKGEGSGGAKLSSSGTTEVKGSFVNIN